MRRLDDIAMESQTAEVMRRLSGITAELLMRAMDASEDDETVGTPTLKAEDDTATMEILVTDEGCAVVFRLKGGDPEEEGEDDA